MRPNFLARFILVAAIIAGGVNSPAFGQSATQVPPAFIDPDQGFVYFLVLNRWGRTINNVFGRVLGYGLRELPGAHLLNNPHQEGLKVSLGKHIPGSVAMYRFQTPGAWMFFPEYTLLINDHSLFQPRKYQR